jgi:hypothetical protein
MTSLMLIPGPLQGSRTAGLLNDFYKSHHGRQKHGYRFAFRGVLWPNQTRTHSPTRQKRELAFSIQPLVHYLISLQTLANSRLRPHLQLKLSRRFGGIKSFASICKFSSVLNIRTLVFISFSRLNDLVVELTFLYVFHFIIAASDDDDPWFSVHNTGHLLSFINLAADLSSATYR